MIKKAPRLSLQNASQMRKYERFVYDPAKFQTENLPDRTQNATTSPVVQNPAEPEVQQALSKPIQSLRRSSIPHPARKQHSQMHNQPTQWSANERECSG